VAEPVRMPLADAARALGTTPDALRQKIKRGKLQAVRDNTGRLLVWVNSDTIPAAEVSSRSVDVQSEQLNDLSGHVKSLEDHVKSLTARLEVADRLQTAHAAEVARLIEDRTRLQDELQKARIEADHTKADQVRMARDVAKMFDELRALTDHHAKLHADRARLQADVDRLAAELEQARRPWWRRLIGI
jgi:chromosome segregation ATPase